MDACDRRRIGDWRRVFHAGSVAGGSEGAGARCEAAGLPKVPPGLQDGDSLLYPVAAAERDLQFGAVIRPVSGRSAASARTVGRAHPVGAGRIWDFTVVAGGEGA